MSAQSASTTRSRPAPRGRRVSRARAWRRRLLLIVGLIVVVASVLSLVEPADHAVREIQLPLRHDDIIRQQAADKGVDASLIAAVIYTESRFRDQTSGAGAKGLMQIMPETADYIAHKSGGTQFTRADLATPQINIAYGTWYLRYLLDKYKGNTILDARRLQRRRGQGRRVARRSRRAGREVQSRLARALQGDARLRPARALGPQGLPGHLRHRARPQRLTRSTRQPAAPAACPSGRRPEWRVGSRPSAARPRATRPCVGPVEATLDASERACCLRVEAGAPHGVTRCRSESSRRARRSTPRERDVVTRRVGQRTLACPEWRRCRSRRTRAASQCRAARRRSPLAMARCTPRAGSPVRRQLRRRVQRRRAAARQCGDCSERRSHDVLPERCVARRTSPSGTPRAARAAASVRAKTRTE